MSKTETKQEIRENLYLYIDMDSLLKGSLEEVAEKVLNLKTRLQNEHQLIKNEPHRYFKYELLYKKGWDDDSDEIQICGVRIETDDEFNKRIDRNKKQKIEAEKAAKTRKEAEDKRRRTLYENLKKEFE